MRWGIRWCPPVAFLLLGGFAWASSLDPAGNRVDDEHSESRLYTERFRPQFHWSPPFGWMNDPNGMVWSDGRYHLFFQYNPDDVQFGSIGWGHTVSEDLFHWQPLPVALPPEGNQLIFSGSVVSDPENTAGLCDPAAIAEFNCLVAIYTAHRATPAGFVQTQDLAFSDDGGVTWTKFEGNPVLDRGLSDFRDPKVFWYEPDQRWIMLVALPLERQVQIFGSRNLRDWEELSTFGPVGATEGVWECPDLIPMNVVEEPQTSKWVMTVFLNPGGPNGGSAGQYFVGEFNGREFVPEVPASAEDVLWLDHGKDFYCATTYANLPPDLPPRWIGWMNNWQYAGEIPTYPWRGSMNVPRSLSLERFPEGLRLRQQPVRELQALVSDGGAFESTSLVESNDLLARDGIPRDSWEMSIRASAIDSGTFGVRLSSVTEDGTTLPTAVIGYRFDAEELFVERTDDGNVAVSEAFPGVHVAPLPLDEGRVAMRLVVDRNSVEVFGNDGRAVISDLIFPIADEVRVELFADGGVPDDLDVRFAPIDSVWR